MYTGPHVVAVDDVLRGEEAAVEVSDGEAESGELEGSDERLSFAPDWSTLPTWLAATVRLAAAEACWLYLDRVIDSATATAAPRTTNAKAAANQR
jgi:hypothetical protein